MATASANPFAPTFGARPAPVASRNHILRWFEAGLAHPSYTLLIAGDRGTGKIAPTAAQSNF